MNSTNHCNFESRSARYNLPIKQPSKWSILVDHILASPMRIHRYRNLSRQIVEDTMREKYCGGRK
jgi:hypothetical protein